ARAARYCGPSAAIVERKAARAFAQAWDWRSARHAARLASAAARTCALSGATVARYASRALFVAAANASLAALTAAARVAQAAAIDWACAAVRPRGTRPLSTARQPWERSRSWWRPPWASAALGSASA